MTSRSSHITIRWTKGSVNDSKMYTAPQAVYALWLMVSYTTHSVINGPMSGTTRVSWYQKKHSPTDTYPDRSVKRQCHDNQFQRQNRPIHLHSLLSHSEMDWNIDKCINSSSDLAISCENLVNFNPVTSDLMKVVRIHPLVDQQWSQFSYAHLAAPLLGTPAISTHFCGAMSTQFFQYYSLRGNTAMPGGLHTRLYHAFLVFIISL